MNEGKNIADTSIAKKKGVSPVVKFRVAGCLMAAAAAVVLKMYGGEVYEKAHDLYEKYALASIVMQESDSNGELMRVVRK